MKVSWEASPFFYLFLVSFFCIDIYGYFILGGNIFATVMILFAVIAAKPIHIMRLAAILFFLSLESFFFYGRSYFCLIYLLPILFVIIKLRDRFWDSFSCMVVTLLAALLGQAVILEFYLLDGALFSLYHVLGIVVNVFLLALLEATH